MYKSKTVKSAFNCLTAILFIAFVSGSCTSAKKLSYFQDLPNTSTVNLAPMPEVPRTIENGDEIYVSFSAKDNQAASFFNRSGASAAPATDATATVTPGGGGSNYYVDPQGYLEFPTIGRIKVAGLTASQLQVTLLKAVDPYLKEPIIEVRFNTFRITLLGEVRSPGTHTLPIQRTTLFEALGAGGDLPLTAQRYDIQLYRDYNGQRKIMRFDLRQADILNNSEIFQIRHNDVIYVQPRASTVTQQNLGFVTGIIGLVVGLVTLGITISNSNN